MKPHNFARVVAGIAALLGLSSAGAFPDKPVQYIVPFAPGGESDVTARLQAEVFASRIADITRVRRSPNTKTRSQPGQHRSHPP